MKVTYSDQYLEQVNKWETEGGLKRQLAKVAGSGVSEIIKNPADPEYSRPYLEPFKKIVLGKVLPPRKEFGTYCTFFQVIQNQITGIQNRSMEDILHIAWINNDHFPHTTWANHLDWSTDPCVCRFKDLLNADQIEKFDKNLHYGTFEISQKIGDDFFHVKLEVGPIDDISGTRESDAQVSAYFEVADKNMYKSNSLQVDGKNRGQAYRLLDVLTTEVLLSGHGIEFSLWAPMEDELESLRSICIALGYMEELAEDVYYFRKLP